MGYLSRSLLGLFPTNLCAGYAASPSLLLFGRYFFTAPAVCARPSLFPRAWLARAAQFREWGEGIQFIGYQHGIQFIGQIFGAGGAIIQKKNKEKEKGKGKEERREKRKKERGEFNLEDPMFLFNFHSFFQKIIK